IDEVARLATTVVRLVDGRVVGQGAPKDVLSRMEPEGAHRTDAVSFLSGTVVRGLPEFGMTILSHPSGEIALPGRFGGAKTLRIAIPAAGVSIATEQPRGISVRTVLKGRIASVAEVGQASAH